MFWQLFPRHDSDIDLLISLEKDSHLGLLEYSRIIDQLEIATRRQVDMVTEGSLKSFAVENVNRDKVLIYSSFASDLGRRCGEV